MNCPNCGAAMSPVNGQAYFRCQHCGTFHFPQTTDDGVATLGETTKFPCPVCKNQLASAAIDGRTVCYCSTCRGLLTTNDEFSRILTQRRAVRADHPALPRSLSREELRRQVGCPKCDKAMDAHPYGGGGNVVIDTCERCQLIWLDAGEMDALARHRPTNAAMTPLYQTVGNAAPSSPDRCTDGVQTSNYPRASEEFSADLLDLFRRIF